MNAIYAIAYIEAWKNQDVNGVWTRNLPIPQHRSNQLTMKPLTLETGSNEPVRNECEVMYESWSERLTGIVRSLFQASVYAIA